MCTHFLFPKSSFRIQRITVLGMFKDCYHSWCESMVIFDLISNRSNVYLILSWFWMATFSSSTSSLPSQNREYHLKIFAWFRASFP
jgi:hypothetical protein